MMHFFKVHFFKDHSDACEICQNDAYEAERTFICANLIVL